MHPNEGLVTSFYDAFAAGDHEAMASCYASSVVFSDPVFPALEYDRATAMWRMFCTSGGDLSVTFGGVEADGTRGSARWEALYTFPPTRRRVHNRIQATFEFEDGLIVRHQDRFDFYRWTRMALGSVGWLLGWTPLVRSRVRKSAENQLNEFIRAEATAE